ncbi:MAG: carboxylating nicotinate-nucleotide diphosphorylase [Fibrobacteres bacterium]|nr:carboxylating nicotinate-nucleotide diphosphorylase [Fibrobacterota bacterium]
MTPRFNPTSAAPIIELALREDIGKIDVTSALLSPHSYSVAEIIAREEGVIAGLPVIKEVFRRITKKITVDIKIKEGAKVKKGCRIALIKGATGSILTGERTALNILSIMSGIATITSQYVSAVKGTSAKVYDTRKTVPGFRYLSKYAVKIGGGQNHRMGLYDMVLIKDNHIAASGITSAIKEARRRFSKLPVMVETENWKQFLEALNAKPDFILLDNMSPAEMKQAAAEAKKLGKKRPLLEASGGITIKSLREVAKSGVDRISVGAITHSYKNMDLAMEIVSSNGR